MKPAVEMGAQSELEVKRKNVGPYKMTVSSDKKLPRQT